MTFSPLKNKIRIPLFDRFEGDEESSERFYTRDQIIESIERDINRLLKTRATLKREDLQNLSKNPSSWGFPGLYGLPDFSQYDGANPSHWPSIARLCQQTLERYEPRLKNIAVRIVTFHKKEQSLEITIHAKLGLKEYKGDVEFKGLLSLLG